MTRKNPKDKYVFKSNGRELWLDTPEPQRRFDNMLYNNAYFAIIDQCASGTGRHMTGDGYINNVVTKDRCIYVRDDQSGKYFTINYRPVFRDYQSYRCGQGLCYNIIENVTNGLKAVWRIFVPAGDDPIEIWDVKIVNEGGKRRKVSLFTSVQMECDGVDTYGGAMFRYANYYPEQNAIFVRCDAEKFTEIDFPNHSGFFTADRELASWEAWMGKFIGSHNTVQNPVAVEQGDCGRHYASTWTPTGTLQVSFDLPKGASENVRFLVGACNSLEHIDSLRKKYLVGSLDKCPVFDELRAERQRMMTNITVDTPDKTINNLLNIWGKQQSHYLATWCRWGYKGYRDIVQMSQGVLYWDLPLAKKNLIRALEHQYADGFALRGWHPLDPMRYVDCASWLISAITEYIKETGDIAFLDQSVNYLDQGQAPVYEHLMQIMRRLRTDRGSHGLCLAFFGDWNDSLTGVCKKGRGESVWMSMAFCRCSLLMEELAEHLGHKEDAATLWHWRKEMADAINEHAWDGKWYLCALDDDANPIGSEKNEEGKIYLNMQSWAQLGRVCDDARWESSLASVEKHLDSGWGLVLNWPTYTKPTPNVGRLSYLRPGICENGTVYTHGVAFMYLALLERGLADKALKVFRDVHPANPKRPVSAQPNVLVNGYGGPATDRTPGEVEHAWTTGSASWIISTTLEYMLGLRRTYDGLVICPCLPSEFQTASITRTFRGTTYNITLNNKKRRQNPPVKSITIDGKDHPIDKPLPLDNSEHEVKVLLD